MGGGENRGLEVRASPAHSKHRKVWNGGRETVLRGEGSRLSRSPRVLRAMPERWDPPKGSVFRL